MPQAPEDAEFLADSQVPSGVVALAGVVTAPAWRTKPGRYLVATDDHVIPPPAMGRCRNGQAPS